MRGERGNGGTCGGIFFKCKKLAQKDYNNWEHDKVAQMIHWRLREKVGFERGH